MKPEHYILSLTALHEFVDLLLLAPCSEKEEIFLMKQEVQERV
jgi:hypothetical protein